MRSMRWMLCGGLFLAAVLPAAQARAATTVYEAESTFLAALPGGHTLESFDEFSAGTLLTNQVPGVVFSNAGTLYTAISATQSLGAVSAPNILAGGNPRVANTGVPQIIHLALAPGTRAVGFYLAAQSPDASAATVLFQLADESSRTVGVADRDGNEDTGEFIGAVSDLDIVAVTITSGFEGDTGFFEEMGLDNLFLGSAPRADTTPPVCSGRPSIAGGVEGIDGAASDSNEGDSGIASVVLEEGAVNVTLIPDPAFKPGAPETSFRVAPTNPGADGHGIILVTDGAGLTCDLPVTFRAIVAGPTTAETICLGDGVLLSVSNPLSSPGGEAACSAETPGPSDPPMPPGYEPSPESDPFPCEVLTIQSPISGSTFMAYKKDGPFEPRLRLLYSKFDGTQFPPFSDITASVDSIATLTPDPTRVTGSGTWSQVKIACAIQAEICNGLDDDGDGLIDEGLPVGLAPVDADGDGVPICPSTAGGAFDCDDQDAAIHPGAAERCNGLDDNCDGRIDEGNPPGGAACTIPGLQGVCAAGETSCAAGPMVCQQVHFPSAEICDGQDNDCNGQVDEDYAFGGYLQPVNADGTSIFKAGRTVPLKFQLHTCAGALVTNAVAHLSLFFYAAGVVGSEIEDVTSAGQANTDDLYRFDPTSGQYIYNLSTLGLRRNSSYLVRTTLDDGSQHDVVISIR